MWWFRAASLVLPLVLVACGYSPVYGPGQTGAARQGSIAVEAPTNRDSFMLVQHLEQRLGRSTAPTYQLDYTLVLVREELGISTSGARTRYNLVGAVSYSLVDLNSGQIVMSDNVQDFTAYSAAGTTIATFSAEQDARRRLMVTLGDRITARILAAGV